MKKIKLLIISILCLNGLTTYASSCTEELHSKLAQDSNIRIVRVINNYTCGKANSCALVYEQDNQPFANIQYLAYLDQNNNIIEKGGLIYGSQFSGWELTGSFFCADIKTYISGDMGDDKSIQIEISKETARDMLFCPIQKTFLSYATQCQVKN